MAILKLKRFIKTRCEYLTVSTVLVVAKYFHFFSVFYNRYENLSYIYIKQIRIMLIVRTSLF